MKKMGWQIIAFILILSLLPNTALAVGEGEWKETNMTLYHTATASSNEDKALLAVDGINENSSYTYWEPEENDENPWLQVDLELSYTISRIELEARKGEEASLKNFEVWGSNSEEFEDYAVLVTSANKAPENGIFSEKSQSRKSFRYLRVVKTKKGEDFSIGEFRAWVNKDKILHGTQIAEGNTQVPVWDKEGTYTIPSDILGTELEKTVGLLGALNIMRGYPDGNFLPDEPVTRAEFVTTAVKMVQLDENLFVSDPSYIDVATEHWAFSSIETATQIGMVSGMGDGTFAPEAKVTMAQAVRVMVTLLGYEVVAENRGGWSAGYIALASQLKILDGVKSSADEQITRGEVAELLYNALHTEVMETSVGKDAVLERQDYTLMNANMGIYKASGQVTATDLTGISDYRDKAAKGFIKINDEAFECDFPKAEDFIGLPVDYYYRGEHNPVIILLQTKRNVEATKVDAKNILGFDDSGVFTYEKYDGKEIIEIDVADTADILYNGKAVKGYKNSELIPKSGSVTLYDINSDGRIDIVSVKEAVVHVVKYANDKEHMIAFKDTTSPLTFNGTKDEVEIISAETGENIELASLAEWDIVSVMESKNKTGAKSLRIFVSKEAVQGMVKEITDDDVLIGSKRYTLAECMDKTEIVLGLSGKFCLDMDGRIAAFDGSNLDGDYGYLIGADETKKGIDRPIKIRIFTKKGVIEELAASDKLLVDNTEIKSLEALNSHLLLSGRISGELHQVVKFKQNNKKEITEIDTTQTGEGETSENLTKDISSLKTDGTTSYSRTLYGGVFDCDFSYDPNAVIFSVPDDVTREKDFSVLSVGMFKNGSSYAFDAYDGGIERKMKLMVFTDSAASTIANRSDILIVKKIIDAIDSNGDTRKRLDGFYRGNAVSYFEYEEGLFSANDVKQGDILQITLTQSNEIKMLRKLFIKDLAEVRDYTVSAKYPEYARTTDVSSVMTNNFYIGYGRVVSREGNIITVEYVTNVAETLRKTVTIDLSYNKTELYIYDSTEKNEENKVRIATASDFADAQSVGNENASMVFFMISSVEPYCAIVLK